MVKGNVIKKEKTYCSILEIEREFYPDTFNERKKRIEKIVKEVRQMKMQIRKGTMTDYLLEGNLIGQPRHTVILFCALYRVPHTKFSKKTKTGFYGLLYYNETNTNVDY